MDDLDALARLTARIETLERRVCVLEHSSETAVSAPAEPVSPVVQAPISETLPFAQDGGVFPVLGKAMLGIAGAYLLRAVAESGSFPKLAVVVLALAYAAMWLVWAARVPAEARFASTVYAATSALILAPMLWELTLRFEVLPTMATAGVLGMFVVTAYALAWKRSLVPVVWVASVAAVLTTLALLIATRDLVPFILALLLMAVASEVTAYRNRWLGLRPLIAVAVDLAIWILLYLYSRPEGLPPEYKNVAAPLLLALGCTLLLVYGVSTVLRTTRLRQKISVFEIGQTVIAFLLAAFSILHFGASAGALLLGAFCLLLSAACYAAAYAYFDRFPERFPDQRTFHVYATWSMALLLVGSSLCLPALLLALCLSMAAIMATLLGVRGSRLTLEFHGLAYLAAAAYASGLLDYAGRALAGTFPAAPGWIVWIVAASAVACYAVGGRFRAKRWNQRFLQLLSAILAVAAMITFLVSVLVWLAAIGMTPGASQVAVIRTLITCGVALALAFSGSRWQRAELVWIAYGALALVTAKLLFEDLQHGHPASTAVSIFLYAVALILVPRMARIARRT
ncbi:MAG: hypothetical protein LAO30_00750 [Acidobacteriia bacterium]|nr:hypothetical protein [Terriglobia bacterium]